MIKKKLIYILYIFLLLCTPVRLTAQYVSIPFFENTNIFYGQEKKIPVGANSISKIGFRIQPNHICFIDFTIKANIKNLVNFIYRPKTPEGTGNFNMFGISLNFPSIGNAPISFGIFSGEYDRLGSDSILQEHLKTKIKEPEFRKFYPAYAFKPQTPIEGLGISLYGASNKGIYAGTYLYWNKKINKNLKFKMDTRLGGLAHNFSFDFFTGIIIPININKVALRLGTTMLFTTDSFYEFFVELGLAPISIKDFSAQGITSNFYGSFEARINKHFIKTAIACFVSPVFLLPEGITDIQLKKSSFVGLSTMITFGDLYLYKMEGGISILASVNPKKPAIITPFSLSISPFYTFRIERFEIDLRLPFNPLLYKNLKNMFTGQISLKVVY